MYDINHLQNLKNIVSEKIQSDENNRHVLDKSRTASFFQIDVKSLTPDKYVIATKVDNTFRFNEYKHIIDFERLDAERKSYKLCDELDVIVTTLVEFFRESEYKTKKGDKLYFLCPRSIGEYCPICSFINSIRSLKNIPSIYNSNKFINRDDNNLIYLTKFLVDIDKLIELLASNIYVMQQFYLPCVIFDESSSEATINLLGIDRKNLTVVNDLLAEELTAQDKSIDDVENFTFRCVGDLVYRLEAINLSKFSEDFIEFINENLQKINVLNKLTIENKLFSKKSENIAHIQHEFESIFNRTAEDLCESLEKISSMEGVI